MSYTKSLKDPLAEKKTKFKVEIGLDHPSSVDKLINSKNEIIKVLNDNGCELWWFTELINIMENDN